MYSNLDWDDKAKTLIKNLLKAQEEGRVSSTCPYGHHVHTPFELCREILDKLPDKWKEQDEFLVEFTLEFLYELSKDIDFASKKVYYYTLDTNKAKLATLLFPSVKILDKVN